MTNTTQLPLCFDLPEALQHTHQPAIFLKWQLFADGCSGHNAPRLPIKLSGERTFTGKRRDEECTEFIERLHRIKTDLQYRYSPEKYRIKSPYPPYRKLIKRMKHWFGSGSPTYKCIGAGYQMNNEGEIIAKTPLRLAISIRHTPQKSR